MPLLNVGNPALGLHLANSAIIDVQIYHEPRRAAVSFCGYAPVPAFAATDIPAGPAEFPLRLSSAKTVAYCHSQHRNIASLRRLAPDPVVEMARQAALARGIKEGDWVRIKTPDGSAVARAKLVAGLSPDAVFGQHGWWIDGPSGSPYDASHPL
jgi:anaerobic selenocysteine-containing dehydrogenase